MLELHAGDARVLVDPAAGGRVASFTLAGRERLVTRTAGPMLWGSFPMVPWAGRVRHGRFHHLGREHVLPLGLPPHAIHGTGYLRPWDVEAGGVLSSALGPDWPWPGHAVQRFSLTGDRFECTLEVHAERDAFPAQVGWHPWFARPLELSFRARARYRRDHEGIPDGVLEEPGPGPWDDCFTGLAEPPRLAWDDGCTVTVRSSCDHWVVYDQPAHAVCVEPQSGPPDAFTLAPQLVEPGRPLVHTMTWSWDR